jgi:hypothetical protein
MGDGQMTMPAGAWKIMARRDGWTEGIELAVLKGDTLVRLTFEPYERYGLITDPTLLDHGEFMKDGFAPFLQVALDAAWEMGLRPAGLLDTRESMKATAAHLEDMRAIAFHKIGADKPDSHSSTNKSS